MADRLGPPPTQVPMYDAAGNMDPQWIAWFTRLWQLAQ